MRIFSLKINKTIFKNYLHDFEEGKNTRTIIHRPVIILFSEKIIKHNLFRLEKWLPCQPSNTVQITFQFQDNSGIIHMLFVFKFNY